MQTKIYAFLLFICVSAAALAQQIQSPAQFLGYTLGSQFTPHHRIVAYAQYLAQNSKNLKLVQYGTTNENRPLYLAFIASDENIGRLEDIRQNNLKLAGMLPGGGQTNGPAVLWLSYNVHGNESSSSEASMQMLYDLLNPSNTQTKEWLKNTVVILDPCLNPDGRERYINFYNSVRGNQPDPNPQSREHMEPWPGGRINHYYFDLNRDWAWQTQKEVQARLVYYNQWLPQVHVDYHEQSYNAPYYFAPAAEPMHKDITAWQREFQVLIGKNNAKYFDAKGWTYFTKEEFDLLYPSYGDTYPIYSGAIGMTFEQGGSGAGGLAVITRSGDTLTLADRILHHSTTGLSTLEMVSGHAQKLLTEYKKYFDANRANPPGDYKAYVVKNDNEDKMAKLAAMLARNAITYSFGNNKDASGFNYFSNKTEGFHIGPNDMVINAAQPKAVLLNVLMEQKTFMTDSNTYDITAWALPYAYGLKTYGVTSPVAGGSNAAHTQPTAARPAISNAYAYVLPWKSLADVRFLADLQKAHIKVRYAEKPFEAAGKKFDAGTLIIARAGNSADYDRTVTDIAIRNNRNLTALTTGFVDKGADFGSGDVHYLKQPRVMLLCGETTNATSVGEVWHYFDQQINYPVSLVKLTDLNRVKLSDFDVIIMPDGNYNEPPVEKLQGWIRDGGKLIALGDAVTALAGRNGFGVKRKEDKKDDKADAKNKYAAIKSFDERSHEAIRGSVPGAIYKINIDNSHPLGFGYPKYYYTIKLDDTVYDFLGDDGWNVGTIKKDGYVAGFVGQQAKVKIADGMLLGVQSMGRGSVVYIVDDPLFRSFWENGKLLFGNAVFMVGN
ncbi:M14 metallopeptidase family protein [Mucilaginibacter ginkgonis]|uniref:Zinc carboxypeptidase n=1 Tax=Mucilaginibacter ginkgonis TaxID=2682091 RepID=A0A6I4HZZ5_9SPHI|nr:M14 metallopeptidase family protein [Mucilaginibacter ginkgonis]QQL49512.1 zinc carboxypeptidase [Mucilaginibacter ginkgonis]